VLDVIKLNARYGAVSVLHDVTFQVREGDKIAVIGPNGAGKSTLLNALSGIVPPKAETINFDGKSLLGVAPHRISRLGLLQVPEGRQVIGPLSVEENLELGSLAARDRNVDPAAEMLRVFRTFPRLEERRKQEAGSLSGGEQQMLAIGRAMMGKPKILLLDEPSLGLAPVIVDIVFDALTRLNREGLTLVLVEQNARRALEITDVAFVLEQGRIARHDKSAALLNDPQIIDHYLGRA
jgi:branched-chain amino acid transport system ATP-binding protein